MPSINSFTPSPALSRSTSTESVSASQKTTKTITERIGSFFNHMLKLVGIKNDPQTMQTTANTRRETYSHLTTEFTNNNVKISTDKSQSVNNGKKINNEIKQLKNAFSAKKESVESIENKYTGALKTTALKDVISSLDNISIKAHAMLNNENNLSNEQRNKLTDLTNDIQKFRSSTIRTNRINVPDVTQKTRAQVSADAQTRTERNASGYVRSKM